MNVYISGPMTGIPHFNRYEFDAVADLLRDRGHIVFSPVDKDENMYGDKFFSWNVDGSLSFAESQFGFSLNESLAEDLAWICRHADALYMLDGWENSSGARAEHALGIVLGLTICYERGEIWI